MVTRYACRRRRALQNLSALHATGCTAGRDKSVHDVSDDDVQRSMKQWPTCRLPQWQPTNVAANVSSRAVVSPSEGVGIRFCYLIGPRAQVGPTAVSVTSSSSSATRREQMILSGRRFF